MARLPRLIVPGCPHHVTQRGNHRQTVFFSDGDRRMYLTILRDHCRSHQVQIIAWCLMQNHVHFVVIPHRGDSLAVVFGRTHNEYARWLHVRLRQVGHLWQNRFYSCPLEEPHLWEAVRYVELNPVGAGLAGQAWEWPWSSAMAHIRGEDEWGLIDLEWWRRQQDSELWRLALVSGFDEAEIRQRLREATRTGRPLGSDNFVEGLETTTGRTLRLQRRGPKPKRLEAASQLSFGIS